MKFQRGSKAERSASSTGVAADEPAYAPNLVVRPLEQPVEQAELREYPQSRGMDGVAAEVAQEVAMLLEDGDGHPGAREEQARDHPGRAAADDAEIVLNSAHG